MTNKYLGEFSVKIEESPFANYKPQDWVMYFIENYSQIDGSHHKQWVIDQVAQILKGTPVIIKQARWEDTQEYSVSLGAPSKEYRLWVKNYKKKDYSYEKGIAS